MWSPERLECGPRRGPEFPTTRASDPPLVVILLCPSPVSPTPSRAPPTRRKAPTEGLPISGLLSSRVGKETLSRGPETGRPIPGGDVVRRLGEGGTRVGEEGSLK